MKKRVKKTGVQSKRLKNLRRRQESYQKTIERDSRLLRSYHKPGSMTK